MRELKKKIIKLILVEKNLPLDGQEAYHKYISAMTALGRYCRHRIFINSVREEQEEKKRHREFREKQLSLQEHACLDSLKINIENRYLQYSAVQKLLRPFVKSAWKGKEVPLFQEDMQEEKQTGSYQSSRQRNNCKRVASNTYWSDSARDDFEVGMQVLEKYCPDNQENPPCNGVPSGSIEEVEDEEEFSDGELLDIFMANEAIQSYKTKKQKALLFLSRFIAFLAAIACGVLLAVGIWIFSIPALLAVGWWLCALVIAIGALMLCAGVLANYVMLQSRIYSFFNYLFGKDSFCDGFEYINKFGEKSELSLGKKVSLPLLFFLALSVGVAQGGLVAGGFINLRLVLGFTILTTGLGASICFLWRLFWLLWY